uniref:FLYWCH-type domain-containing protein n=1 Tax=Heterorhabditis bacteriophora TaxID=37862 RepID=A0A1I7WZD9_HETBA
MRESGLMVMFVHAMYNGHKQRKIVKASGSIVYEANLCDPGGVVFHRRCRHDRSPSIKNVPKEVNISLHDYIDILTDEEQQH